MNIKCSVGFHDWTNDCEICSNCGRTRFEKHVLQGCQCSVCGKVLHSESDFKCLRCGEELDESTFTDDRDGHFYKIRKIGRQILMAENLAYNASWGNCWAYNHDKSNAEVYGFLYDWDTALKVAPKGWHLPSREEWNTLYRSLVGDRQEGTDRSYYLKSALSYGGTSGFNAKTGGMRTPEGDYTSIGNKGFFWSDTRVGNGVEVLYIYDPPYGAGSAKEDYYDSRCGLSIRLFKD